MGSWGDISGTLGMERVGGDEKAEGRGNPNQGYIGKVLRKHTIL